MAMGMRARKSVNISEDLTQAIAPYVTALHDASLHSHCSSCFRGIPAQSPRDMSCTTCGSVQYCCSDCLISDCEVHSSSGECCFFVKHLREGSPSTLTEETSDIRAALRLLFSLEMRGLVSSDSISSSNRICGLSASGIREVLEEGGEIAERMLEGSLLMLSARKLSMKNSVDLSNGLTIEKVALWAVMTNSVEVQISEEQSLGIAVYGPSFSWFNHSCCPNASYRFLLAPQNEGCTSNKPESCVIPVTKELRQMRLYHLYLQLNVNMVRKLLFAAQSRSTREMKLPKPYVDLILDCDARNLNSLDNAVTDPAIEDLDNLLQQAISEYSFLDDSKACCDVIESILSENLMSYLQQEELSPRKYILQPLHHISVSSFMILASAYRCSAFKSSTDNLHGKNCDVIFRMTKAAAAYSIVLAGATHNLFLSECSFVTLLSHFLLSTGQSTLEFVECIKGETRKNISEVFSFASCSTNLAKHDSVHYNQFRSTCEMFGKHLLSLSLQCWPFLAQGLPCLEKIKNPIDFSWLGPAIFQAFQVSEEDSANLSCKHGPATLIEEQKECILTLAVCCITYSKYLAGICYGPQHYLADRAKDLLEYWVVKIFGLNNSAKVNSRIKMIMITAATEGLVPTTRKVATTRPTPETTAAPVTAMVVPTPAASTSPATTTTTSGYKNTNTDEYGSTASYNKSNTDDLTGSYNKIRHLALMTTVAAAATTNPAPTATAAAAAATTSPVVANTVVGTKESGTGDDYGRGGECKKSSSDDYEGGYKKSSSNDDGYGGRGYDNTDNYESGYNKSGTGEYGSGSGYSKSGTGDYGSGGGGYNKSSTDNYMSGYNKSGRRLWQRWWLQQFLSDRRVMADEYGRSGYGRSGAGAGDDYESGGYNRSGGADEYGRRGGGGGYNKPGGTDDYDSGYNKSGGGDDYGGRAGGGYNKSGTDDYDSGYNNRSGVNEEYGRNKSGADDYDRRGGGYDDKPTGDDEYSGRGAEADEEYRSSFRDDPEKYRKEEKEHKNKERLGEVGALAAGAFAMYERHQAKKDPENAQRHRIEEGVAAVAALGSGGFAFHEHHDKKEAKQAAKDAEEEEEESGSGRGGEGKKKHHFFG
uniref:SET domain-containing protein n=1 Tax=Oryza punctata TaxID=4537 RepID=A0A0E0KQK9_ORYPU